MVMVNVKDAILNAKWYEITRYIKCIEHPCIVCGENIVIILILNNKHIYIACNNIVVVVDCFHNTTIYIVLHQWIINIWGNPKP